VKLTGRFFGLRPCHLSLRDGLLHHDALLFQQEQGGPSTHSQKDCQSGGQHKRRELPTALAPLQVPNVLL
jgi:hypothetical protein